MLFFLNKINVVVCSASIQIFTSKSAAQPRRQKLCIVGKCDAHRIGSNPTPVVLMRPWESYLTAPVVLKHL